MDAQGAGELVMASPPGAFVVWGDASGPGQQLTMNGGDRAVTLPVVHNPDGTVKLDGSADSFPSLDALVQHYAGHTSAELPRVLVLPPLDSSPGAGAAMHDPNNTPDQFVDDLARAAPWFRAGPPVLEAENQLQGLGSFLVREPTEEEKLHGAAYVVAYVDPSNQLQHEPIRATVDGLNMGASPFSFRALSEMIYIYSNNNGERPFLLSLVRGPQDHEAQPW